MLLERAFGLLKQGMGAAIEEEDTKDRNMDNINTAYMTLTNFCDLHLRQAEQEDKSKGNGSCICVAAQVARSMLFKWTRQFGQSEQQERNTTCLVFPEPILMLSANILVVYIGLFKSFMLGFGHFQCSNIQRERGHKFI